MDIKDQIRITEELLEGVKELNGEYQEGWENNILEAENLLKHLKQVKNNDLLHSVSHCEEIEEDEEIENCPNCGSEAVGFGGLNKECFDCEYEW